MNSNMEASGGSCSCDVELVSGQISEIMLNTINRSHIFSVGQDEFVTGKSSSGRSCNSNHILPMSHPHIAMASRSDCVSVSSSGVSNLPVLSRQQVTINNLSPTAQKQSTDGTFRHGIKGPRLAPPHPISQRMTSLNADLTHRLHLRLGKSSWTRPGNDVPPVLSPSSRSAGMESISFSLSSADPQTSQQLISSNYRSALNVAGSISLHHHHNMFPLSDSSCGSSPPVPLRSALLSPKANSSPVRAGVAISMNVPPPLPPVVKEIHVLSVRPNVPVKPSAVIGIGEIPGFVRNIKSTVNAAKKRILKINGKKRAPVPSLHPTSITVTSSFCVPEKLINDGSSVPMVPVVKDPFSSTATPASNQQKAVSFGEDASESTLMHSTEKSVNGIDLPLLSPMGSLENLYEAIISTHSDMSTVPHGRGSVCFSSVLDRMQGSDQSASCISSDCSGCSSDMQSHSHSYGMDDEGDDEVSQSDNRKNYLLVGNLPIYEEIGYISLSSVQSMYSNAGLSSTPAPVGMELEKLLQEELHSVCSSCSPSQVGATSCYRGSNNHKEELFNPPEQHHSGEKRQHKPHPTNSTVTVPSRVLPAASCCLNVGTQSASSRRATSSLHSHSPSGTPSLSPPVLCMNNAQSVPAFLSAPPLHSQGESLPLPLIPHLAFLKENPQSDVLSSSLDGVVDGGKDVRLKMASMKCGLPHTETSGADRYVSMEQPMCGEEPLGQEEIRQAFTLISGITHQTLRTISTRLDYKLAGLANSLRLPPQTKWADFDIFGAPLHATHRCVVYSAKLRAVGTSCQIMILHLPPTSSSVDHYHHHPHHLSLLQPTATFVDTVPFSFLPADFRMASQPSQRCTSETASRSVCLLAMGDFNIRTGLFTHLNDMRREAALSGDVDSFRRHLLVSVLQVLSAVARCMECDVAVTETDLEDMVMVELPDIHGKVLAFLPYSSLPKMPQEEAVCAFLGFFLQQAVNGFNTTGLQGGDELLETVNHLLGIVSEQSLGHLTILQTTVQAKLWIQQQDLIPIQKKSLEHGVTVGRVQLGGVDGRNAADWLVWLEVERAKFVADFACSNSRCNRSAGKHWPITIDDYYHLQFLLKCTSSKLQAYS